MCFLMVGTFGVASRVLLLVSRCSFSWSTHSIYRLPLNTEALVSFFVLPRPESHSQGVKTAGGCAVSSHLGWSRTSTEDVPAQEFGASCRMVHPLVSPSCSIQYYPRLLKKGGRVMYVAGALEYERPFLGPLYRFMAPFMGHSPEKVDTIRAVLCQVFLQPLRGTV